MENKRDCPVSGCSFRGNIESIVSHVERISNPLHSWSALGFDHPDLYRGNAFHQSGKEAFKEENFEEALILLEKAAQFLEEVLSTKDCSSKELFDQVSLLLELRDQAEKSKQEHDIDLLINSAINHRDMGDSYYASDKIEAAED